MNRLVSKLYDLVACLHPCLRSRIAVDDVRKHRAVKPDACHKDQRKRDCHDKIKNRACRYNRSALQHGLVVKAPRVVACFVLAFHHAGTSKRQQLKGILRLPLRKADHRRPKSQAKFVYLNVIMLCQQKMPQFVKQNNHTENNQCQNNIQFTTCFLSIHKQRALFPGSV